MALSMISQLNNNNYAEWIVGIEALLTHKGLWEVTCAPATDTHPNGSNNTKAIYSWRAKITEAHAELILNIKLTQYTHVQSTDMHECSKKGHYQCNCPSNESTNVAFYANVPNSPVLGPVCHSDKEDEILAW
ncbi:hypothetical protein V8D89_008602 [Ganoderma adspersum]